MPRYFFHLRNSVDAEDYEGLELPDVGAARERAVAYALDMTAASVLEQRKINLHHRIEVADEQGQTVITVEFGDVVKIET
jgi:hypothetical protein